MVTAATGTIAKTTAPVVTAATGTVAPVVTAATGTIAKTTAPVVTAATGTVAPVVTAATGTIAKTTAPVVTAATGTVAPVVTIATGTVAPVASTATGTVAKTTAPVAKTTAPVAKTVAPVAKTIAPVVTAAAGTSATSSPATPRPSGSPAAPTTGSVPSAGASSPTSVVVPAPTQVRHERRPVQVSDVSGRGPAARAGHPGLRTGIARSCRCEPTGSASVATVAPTSSLPTVAPDAHSRLTHAGATPGGMRRPSPAAPVPGPSVFAGGADAAGGGLGFSFFFGIAALLALAALVVPSVIWTLAATVRPAPLRPFLSLLERPG